MLSHIVAPLVFEHISLSPGYSIMQLMLSKAKKIMGTVADDPE
jgi:hypothetical protein